MVSMKKSGKKIRQFWKNWKSSWAIEIFWKFELAKKFLGNTCAWNLKWWWRQSVSSMSSTSSELMKMLWQQANVRERLESWECWDKTRRRVESWETEWTVDRKIWTFEILNRRHFNDHLKYVLQITTEKKYSKNQLILLSLSFGWFRDLDWNLELFTFWIFGDGISIKFSIFILFFTLMSQFVDKSFWKHWNREFVHLPLLYWYICGMACEVRRVL